MQICAKGEGSFRLAAAEELLEQGTEKNVQRVKETSSRKDQSCLFT